MGTKLKVKVEIEVKGQGKSSKCCGAAVKGKRGRDYGTLRLWEDVKEKAHNVKSLMYCRAEVQSEREDLRLKINDF